MTWPFRVNFRASIQAWFWRFVVMLVLCIIGGAWAFPVNLHRVQAESSIVILPPYDMWDAILFSVQTISTTGYGNYGDLFDRWPRFRYTAIALMILGPAIWSFLIALTLKWAEKNIFNQPGDQ